MTRLPTHRDAASGSDPAGGCPGWEGGAIAGPLSIVLHELGHFGACVAFRFPDAVLRFSSVSWAGSEEFDRLWLAGDVEAAAAITQPWQVAVVAAAGPVVSYVIAIACVFAVRRSGPGSQAPWFCREDRAFECRRHGDRIRADEGFPRQRTASLTAELAAVC